MNQEVKCNVCGKTLGAVNGFFTEDFLAVTKEWGYFSEKDMEKHSFRVCEMCYNEWINKFIVPITRENVIEVV